MAKKLSEKEIKDLFSQQRVKVEQDRYGTGAFTITVPQKNLDESVNDWRDRTWNIFQQVLQEHFGKENITPIADKSRFDKGYFRIQAGQKAKIFLSEMEAEQKKSVEISR